MTKYDVRLLMELDADNPLGAVEQFLSNVLRDGLRVYMYRVLDMDNDPLGESPMLVQNGVVFTAEEAALAYGLEPEQQYGVDAGTLAEIDAGIDRELEAQGYSFESPDDDDSVVSNVSE